MKRIRVGVMFGGRSSEHLVSIRSASSVLSRLDRQRYDPVALYVRQDGRLVVPDRAPAASTEADAKEYLREYESRVSRVGREAHLVAYPNGDDTVLTVERRGPELAAGQETTQDLALVWGLRIDVVFPVIHGPNGEDGTLQGLLELANVPYVGAGVLGSAVGMDKAVMKVLFAAQGLPVPEHVVVNKREWIADRSGWIERISRRFAMPVFVKPANMGSSVGITKVKDTGLLAAAIDLAAGFDRKVLVEAAVPNVREIECSVLGNDRPEASLPGEIVPAREFYDYEAKYLDEGSTLHVPARIAPEKAEEVRRLAVEAFRAVDASGMGRVDFLMNGETGALFVNEINTIPGFTTISMYPKLWEASGVDYPTLLDRLIALAIERHADRQERRTSAL